MTVRDLVSPVAAWRACGGLSLVVTPWHNGRGFALAQALNHVPHFPLVQDGWVMTLPTRTRIEGADKSVETRLLLRLHVEEFQWQQLSSV